jgi:DNA modification methylase
MTINLNYYYKTELGTLYKGNCCEVLPQIGHFDLLFTDIPFGVGLAYAEYDDSKKMEIYAAECEKWFSAFVGVANLYIVKVPTKNLHVVLPIFVKHLPYIWTVVQFSPNAMTHGPFNLSLYTQYLIAGKPWKRPNQDVFTNTQNKLHTKHPAEMPMAPIEKLFEMFGVNRVSEKTVIDPFLGSGTTAEVCEKLMIPWSGIELTEEYCNMIVKRVGRESNQIKLPF